MNKTKTKIKNKAENKTEKIIGNISGVILAGGQSTRMGTDKAMLKIGGTPAIERICNTLAGVFSDIMVISDFSGNYNYLTANIYPDIYRSMGPLGGIHSALSNTENSHIFVVSCDIPLIDESIIRYILSKKNDNGITLPLAFGRLQPLCGIYSKSCLPVFEGILSGAGGFEGRKSDKLRLNKALENFDSNTITAIDFDRLDSNQLNFNLDCFLNMNDKEDYERICGLAGS